MGAAAGAIGRGSGQDGAGRKHRDCRRAAVQAGCRQSGGASGQTARPLARRITYAVSQTGAVTPDAVDRIGLSLASQLDLRPLLAFDEHPGSRVGAILNQSPAATRDDVLVSLDETDLEFASAVRKAIFTYDHIPQRVNPRDVSKVVRAADQAQLITALAAAQADTAVADFLLANLPTRMADNLREEVAERGIVKAADGEAAMSAVAATVRDLERDGEVQLIQPEEEETD